MRRVRWDHDHIAHTAGLPLSAYPDGQLTLPDHENLIAAVQVHVSVIVGGQPAADDQQSGESAGRTGDDMETRLDGFMPSRKERHLKFHARAVNAKTAASSPRWVIAAFSWVSRRRGWCPTGSRTRESSLKGAGGLGRATEAPYRSLDTPHAAKSSTTGLTGRGLDVDEEAVLGLREAVVATIDVP